jgi:mannose-6-phosphate isomerase-like protein (cupin superfamily)
MDEQPVGKSRSDEVQVFDVGEALKRREPHRGGRVDMASSSNSYIAVFQTPPRGGETHIHQHPDSDQILFVLRGELTIEGDIGKSVLKADQGVLIPAGAYYGFTNTAQEDLIFLSMRTESLGGRRSAYVPNVSSDVRVKIPAEQISAKGLGPKIYLYAISRSTIGISSMRLEEWNKASLIRMDSGHERDGDSVVVRLPERLVQWYEIAGLAKSDYQVIGEPDRTRVRVSLKPLFECQATLR